MDTDTAAAEATLSVTLTVRVEGEHLEANELLTILRTAGCQRELRRQLERALVSTDLRRLDAIGWHADGNRPVYMVQVVDALPLDEIDVCRA